MARRTGSGGSRSRSAGSSAQPPAPTPQQTPPVHTQPPVQPELMNEIKYRRNETASIIIRTIDGRFDSLERALFSIYCNDYPYKEAVIVYQGLNEKYAEELASLRQMYPDMPIQVIHNPTEEDVRAQNANHGIMAATGRYIGFLDDDDAFLSHHISRLVNAIKKTGRAWAYGQVCLDIEDKNGYVTRKEHPFLNAEFSFLRLWQQNFLQNHCFLIDISKLPDKKFAFFVESLNKHEDYGMLLRLALNFEPAVLPDVTCIYKLRKDGSNTILHFGLSLSETARKEKEEEWELADNEIRRLKNELTQDIYWFREVKFPAPYVVYSDTLMGYLKNHLKKYGLVRRAWYYFKAARIKVRGLIER